MSSGPFAKDFDERRRWWNERLWLQMVVIWIIALAAATIVYGFSLLAVVAAAAITACIYLATRLLMR